MSVPSWVTLTEGETVVWSGRPSLLGSLGSLLRGVLVAFAGVAIYVVLVAAEVEPRRPVLVLVLVGGLLMAYAILKHRSTRYVVTTNEVYRKEGLLSRRVTSLRLDRIQNTSFEQSFLQRLLSYGDVNIDTAGTGGTEITFEAVVRPQEVSKLLTEQLDRVDR